MINSKDKLVKWAIVLFFVFLFGFIPPFGAMTQEGMRILGIFIGTYSSIFFCSSLIEIWNDKKIK